MGREFELKYKATAEQLAEIRKQYEGFETITMETTYFDNPAGDFGRMHWTLRRRMENGVSVCTLKTDLVGGGRGEWEVECGNILDAVPLLIAIGAPEYLKELVTEGVSPVCGARFTRQAAKAPAGSGIVEIALDQGVLLGGGKEEPFAEAEVELKSGTDQDATLFAAALAARFGLIPEPKSKLRRARALAGLA